MGYMTESCIVVISLRTFEVEVIIKCFVVERNIPCGINQGVAKKFGTAFRHLGAFGVELTGLVYGGIQTGIS